VSEYVSATYGPPSGLTDRERSLLVYLAVKSVAENRHCSEQAAADLLDDAAGRGDMHIRGDQRRSYVTYGDPAAGGLVLVAAELVVLRQLAHPSGMLDN